MSSLELLGVCSVVLLLIASAMLAMAETSLTHLGKARARALDDEGEPRAKTLLRLLEHRERVLNPILLVVVVCHLGIATIVAILVHDRWGRLGVCVAFVFELVAVFVFGEAVPKTYALMRTDQAALRVTPIARALALFFPLRWAAQALIALSNVILPGEGRREGAAVSEEELLALAGVAADAEVIEVEERALIESILEFGDTIVREVMVPRTDMATASQDWRAADVMEVVILNGYSRLPVTGEGIDDLVGIVYAKDLMRAERDGMEDHPIKEFVRLARYVPETKKVSQLLKEMQAEKFHMAIVVDEYGGTAGLVTLEDLIEELVGEIVDEFDVEDPMMEPLPGGDVRVNARMAIDDVNDLLHGHLPEGDWDTVGGLLFSELGHVPTDGESVDVDGWRLTAERVQGRRIGRVRIARPARPATNVDAEVSS